MASVAVDNETHTFKYNDALLGMVAKVGDFIFAFHMDHFTSFNATSSNGNGILKLYYQQPGNFRVCKREITRGTLLQIELEPVEKVVYGDGDVFRGVTPILVINTNRRYERYLMTLEKIQINLADDQAVVFTIPPQCRFK